MIIKKVALGNSEKAFVISGFSSNVNILFSDDNNKGKTIVIQSMLYSLGNEPSFPASFNYKDYYHYLELEHQGKTIYICRKKNQIFLKFNNKLNMFASISEYKHFWNSNILPLPTIIKNNRMIICDPVLYLQLFSIGQDKKETNNIYNSGYYNKHDFYEMLYSFNSISDVEKQKYNSDKLNKDLSANKKRREQLLKESKLLKSRDEEIGYLSPLVDKNIFESQLQELEELKDLLSSYKIERNKAAVRRTKLQVALKELNSLNRHISVGEVHCLDCNSTHIGYSLQDDDSYSFDISSAEMRKEIIDSIVSRIEIYNDEIDKLDVAIKEYLEKVNDLVADKSITLESVLFYREDVLNVSDIEKEVLEIDNTIKEIKAKIKDNNSKVNKIVAKQKELDKSISDSITEYYNKIDESGTNAEFELFTKRGEVLSGSEATVFYLAKLLSFATILKHDFPIIIDSFRAEDLSSEKEKIVLDLFDELNQQVVLTTTTKIEERNKYDSFSFVKQHDFSEVLTKRLLTKDYVDSFKSLLTHVSINLD